MKLSNSIFLWKTSRLIDRENHFSLEIAKPSEEENLKNSVHWHDYFEFEIMISGKAIHHLNNQSYELVRGDAHLLRYPDFHTNQPIENENVSLYNFNFDEMALPNHVVSFLLNSEKPFIYKYSEDELKEITSDINILLDKNADLSDPLVSTLHSAIFTKIILNFICKCKDKKTEKSSESSISSLNAALSIIQCKFREDITLKQLAHSIGITPNHLGFLFKTQLGENFTDYLKKVRLKHAKSLLKHSDLSIYAVSDYSGFKNTSYFIKCFKEAYGQTPKQYILNISKENKNPSI